MIAELGMCYKRLRKDLRTEINRLKSVAWQELLSSVDEDPWGLPYKLVLKKLKPASLGLTEVLEPGILSELLKSLFPLNNAPDSIVDWSDFTWSNKWAISSGELNQAIKKAAASWTKAPGPDGLRMVIWMQTTREFRRWIVHLFNLCLMRGGVPPRVEGS